MEQENMMSISYFWNRSFLTSRFMLWSLLWINLLGTIYGYQWYWKQMTTTIAENPLWMVIFVPDSPTASLFFTISLIYLFMDSRKAPLIYQPSALRSLIETIAVVTSFKYGIWAVAMIFAGAYYGDTTSWQDWMLTISHLGMAFEGLLFVRFFRIKPIYLLVTACWVFGNDFVDYHFGVFPWLSDSLVKYLGNIFIFTVFLSLLSLIICYVFDRIHKNGHPPIS